MKKGDVVVENYTYLTFYTIITDAGSGTVGSGVRIALDTDGRLYQVNAEVSFDTQKLLGVLLALPDEMPVNREAAEAKAEVL